MQTTLNTALKTTVQYYYYNKPHNLFPLIIQCIRKCHNRSHNDDVIISSVISEPGTATFERDGRALVRMIHNCTRHGHISYGQQLHSHVVRSWYASSNVYVCTALVGFYAKLVSLDAAEKLFDEMPHPNVVTWNTVISGHLHSGKPLKAISLFLELCKGSEDLRPNEHSFSIALAACGRLSLLRFGASIHARVFVFGMAESVVLGNGLIDMYGKCGSPEEAVRVFDGMVERGVISWNSIIAAFVRNRRLEQALAYFSQMPHPNTISYNELIAGMAQYGDIGKAIEILRSMPDPNSSSWNAIISGYVLRNRPLEALEFFAQMHARGIVKDEFTFSSLLCGVASVSALSWGSLLHCCVMKQGLVASTIIGTALIDMYSKCGQVKEAEIMFHSMPHKNVVSWSTMISGLAHNGESHKVIEYFERLKGVKGLRPDDITFVNLLAACSHNKMPLERAYEYFASMMDDYQIKPRQEHVASMVRLMGHHGEVCRAEKMIHDLGFGACKSVWRALLGACGDCGNLEVAKVAAAKLTELEKNDEFGYVILSNVNKGHGNWMDATEVWREMRDKGVMKEAGCSRVEG